MNDEIIKTLNLTEGNLYHIASKISNRTELSKPKKYEILKDFVKEKFISFLPRANHLSKYRFLNETFSFNISVIVCDF